MMYIVWTQKLVGKFFFAVGETEQLVPQCTKLDIKANGISTRKSEVNNAIIMIQGFLP